jgi:hypothetical protein
MELLAPLWRAVRSVPDGKIQPRVEKVRIEDTTKDVANRFADRRSRPLDQHLRVRAVPMLQQCAEQRGAGLEITVEAGPRSIEAFPQYLDLHALLPLFDQGLHRGVHRAFPGEQRARHADRLSRSAAFGGAFGDERLERLQTASVARGPGIAGKYVLSDPHVPAHGVE